MKTVSVIITCFNSEKYIEKCLKGVLNQTYPIKEIIVIDGGSSDNTPKILSKFSKYKKIKIIVQPKNFGLAKDRNTGILHSKSELVAFLDADCVPHRNWLKELVKNINGNVVGASGRLIEKYKNTLGDRWRVQHMSQDAGRKKIELNYLPGNNNVYLRNVLIEVGMFDEYFKTNGEDVDIGKRLREKGYKLVHEPNAIVYHLRKDDIFSVLKSRWKWANAKKGIRGSEVYSLTCLTYKILCIFFWFFRFIVKDLKTKEWELVLVDLVMPFYWLKINFWKYFSHKKDEIEAIFQSMKDIMKK